MGDERTQFLFSRDLFQLMYFSGLLVNSSHLQLKNKGFVYGYHFFSSINLGWTPLL